MKITPIVTSEAPAPAAAYSQAVVVDGWLYCSGQIPIDPDTKEMVTTDDIRVQTERVLVNLSSVLRAANADFTHVVKATVYLVDMEEFSKMNEVYSRFINPRCPPARACVQVAALPKGARVEIDVVARVS